MPMLPRTRFEHKRKAWPSYQIVGQVSVYGLKGNLKTPDGASRSYSIRCCFEFSARPSYYVRVCLGAESGEPRIVEDFTLPDSNLDAARLAIENIVQLLTQRFRDHGPVGVAQWLFGAESSGPQVNGVNGLH